MSQGTRGRAIGLIFMKMGELIIRAEDAEEVGDLVGRNAAMTDMMKLVAAMAAMPGVPEEHVALLAEGVRELQKATVKPSLFLDAAAYEVVERARCFLAGFLSQLPCADESEVVRREQSRILAVVASGDARDAMYALLATFTGYLIDAGVVLHPHPAARGVEPV